MNENDRQKQHGLSWGGQKRFGQVLIKHQRTWKRLRDAHLSLFQTMDLHPTKTTTKALFTGVSTSTPHIWDVKQPKSMWLMLDRDT